MKVQDVRRRLQLILLGVLCCSQQCLAQGGYNYGRTPDGVARPQAGVAQNALRPIVPGYPTAANAFPTGATTAFGGAANPAAAFGGFPGQPQRLGGTAAGLAAAGLTPTAAVAAGFGGGLLRPVPTNLPQRGAGGIFGPGQQQYGGIATRAGLGGSQRRDGDENGDFSAIPGVPGVNYPVYSQVPQTNFDCGQQPLPGYYADVEALCQAFHICALNRTYSFLCPNGTIFNQETLVCVWWNQYDCATAPSFYANNAYIYDYSKVGAPTAAGYQANQLGINAAAVAANAARQQAANLQVNSGRLPTAPGGIFGAGALRGAGGGFAGLPGNTRFPTTPTAAAAGAAQAFPTGSSAAPFGGVLRGTGGNVGAGGITAGGGGGGGGLQDAAYANSPLAAAAANREYLPPPRRS